MASVRIQGEYEKQRGIYYEYNPSDTPLGEGGMGKVYKGWLCSESTNQRREVAIKFLYSDLPPHVIARARREASVQIRNDNLIEMLGFVETSMKDEIGQPIIRYHVISEFLHGVTLDKVLNGNVCDYKGNVIPFAQELYGKRMNDSYSFSLIIVRNLLSGLMALHDNGYIHRDIDPSNIMVTSNGKIKLIDFGIAKKINGKNTKESSYTVDGQFLGKPKYAAPELVRGLVDSQNSTTDLYAVGILLYQLLVGKVPFDGEMAEVLEMQLTKKIPLHIVKQKQIKEVIKKATQKKRSQRFQSAAEFRVAIDKLGPLQYPAKNIKFKAVGIALGAATFVGIIIGSINIIDDSTALPNPSDSIVKPDAPIIATSQISVNYDKAVSLLSNKETANEGLTMLYSLSDNKDYKAAFLLSRLYFKSADDYFLGSDNVEIKAFADSIELIRNNLGIKPQNEKAHHLLKYAVDLNSKDYRSLFELGSDYKSNRRGTKRNEDSAYIYLESAQRLATDAGDSVYMQAIKSTIKNVTKRVK